MASNPGRPKRPSRPKGNANRSTNSNNQAANTASGSGSGAVPPVDNSSGPSQGPCQDFLKGTCTRGAKCRFSHSSPSSGQNLAANSSGVPHNACREFWHSGNCARGNRCKFEHRRDSKDEPPQPAANLQDHFQAMGSFPGLANDQFSVGGTKATPGQTHHHLKLYTEDSFRFKIADQVYRFLDLLCNASSQNSAWKAEDGQTQLQEIVKGNGILRLGDAIRFPGETNKPWSFQRGYIPILTYMASEWVVKSTIHSDVNALYGLIHTNFEVLRNTIETYLGRLMAARSFKDGNRSLSGKQVFKVIFVTMFEYLTRFKQAKATNPEVCELVTHAANWFDEWAAALKTIPPFDDECSGYEEDMKDCIVENIRRDKDRVLHLVHRGEARVIDQPPRSHNQTFSTEGLLANLQRNCDYDGPGELRELGPRHDNDHASFDRIRIAPTHHELMCEDDPYLPPNFAEAPHFLESKSVERLLDVQFRLLREELIAPVRMAVQLVVSDLLKSDSATTTLSNIIKAGGGRYAAPASAQESVIFSVFTNATFEPLKLDNRGTSVGVEFDTPPGLARSKQAATRAAYWEQVAKKRLMQGGLVALVWKDPNGILEIYIGTIASTPRDLADLARKSEERISLRVSFFDTAAELRIVRTLQHRRENVGTRVLIEAPIFYEGIRPFLEALQVNPGVLPFSQYLCHQSNDELKEAQIAPPLYSLTPRFTFELKDLFPPTAGVNSLTLTTNNPASVALARSTLARGSRLDPSQADAIVDSLTREVSLIQGPPGTGKSYTCLELIRVLIKNKISPILLVAYTNHALDHMLKGVLDADITKNIIRLGSRYAADERIAQFTLEEVEKVRAKTKLDRSVGKAYREMKSTETEMIELMNKISLRHIPPEYIEEHVLSSYPYHYEELFTDPPSWVTTLATPAGEDEDEGAWETAGGRQHDLSILEFWASGHDLAFLRPPRITQVVPPSASQPTSQTSNRFGALAEHQPQGNQNTASPLVDEHRATVAKFLLRHGVEFIPTIPETTRALDELLVDPNVWNMSLIERKTLYDRWYMAASESIRQTQVEDFENLRQKHKDARRNFEEIKEQSKVNILRRTHIIGCTTTGAAKVVSLLSGIEPKVMVVEEAGQVLESHILASLVQSVQHLIMIGDPLQLRPSVNNYKLTFDNPRTGTIYRFDRSLMERLSDGGFPMSQLDVQRRMRPAISSLIKNTLYPNLQDHERVLEYPKVRGMYKDVFFVSHNNREAGGGEDSVSKHNAYELDMIYDLVLHLLRQGCYNKQGNIVILAAYLGQIPKIRKKLQDVVTTIVDDRDSELLAQHGIEEEEVVVVQRVQVSTRVLIRTLDNFQGEEGEIIILSLVRNAGTPFDGTLSSLQPSGGRSQIGFLRSKNRTNVGLSRAKHGMYIFGNAPELARGSGMWASVLQELYKSDCIGKGLPIACHRHPEYVQIVDQPGRLRIVSPDGGCLQPCLAPLPCGHQCPYKCHSDDPQHISTKCTEPCLRLCPLSHPCDRECWECSSAPGDCRFPVRKVPLPCGHTHPQAPCFLSRLPEKIKCVAMVKKKLLFCEHSAAMPCHKDPATHVCQERCGIAYSCCSKSCAATCGNCQTLNRKGSAQPQVGPIPRIQHPKHPCGRVLFCGHSCKDNCTEGHTCSGACKDTCRQACAHGACRLVCSLPCKPCVLRCAWKCPHVQCPSACGMACTRLPCDKKCPKKLKCDHPCPSVCGEPCAQQTCRLCANDNTMDSIVDLVMHVSLRELEDDGTLDSMTITLPCQHVFTVETLDGVTHLGDFYEKDQTGKWIKAITPESSGELRTRPVCPTCRGPITSLRYGRVCKSSNMAIMQHNIASSLSRRLASAERQLATSRAGLNAAVTSATTRCLPILSATDITEATHREVRDKLDLTLIRDVNRPTPTQTLRDLNEFHAYTEKDAELWRKAVGAILTPYSNARSIACERDPSVQAYEATLAALYQEELSHFGNDLSRGAPQDVEQRALGLARMRIGQPPPRASLRFVVEAFWVTTDILMLLGLATHEASDEIRRRDCNDQNSSYWTRLAEFFFKRAVEDAEVALKLAESSESWNKAVKCQVILLRTQYELAAHDCRTTVDNGGTLDPNTRALLVQMCEDGIQNVQQYQSTVPRSYLRLWGNEQRTMRQEWVQTNFTQPSNVILDSWKQLKRSAESGTWYSEVTNEERAAILNAMMQGSGRERGLSHTGHFYQCPNGHPYVIGECGGAMQASTCPECGARIGGANHRAAAGNTLAADFVNLARTRGAQESPWQWGPNAGRR